MLKKIDQLLIKQFIPPFILAYSIALFVLLMVVLWQYIDDIAGKGISGGLIFELLLYQSISLVPIALTLGMLIASVMTMGNMAEQYELSSIKSAGISLWRSMRAMLTFSIIVAIFSIYCSNTLIPIANLKVRSRMFDIQDKAPTLQMEAGTFNYDFNGYAVHFKSKSKDGQSIQDVLIYDHSSEANGQVKQIMAERGEMFTVANGDFFVMKFYNGFQYIDQRNQGGKSAKAKYPFVRVGFDEHEIVFDLTDFKLERSNPALFSRSRKTMTGSELLGAIDSIAIHISKRTQALANYFGDYFTPKRFDNTHIDEQAARAYNKNQPSSKDTTRSQMNSFSKAPIREHHLSSGNAYQQHFDQPVAQWANFMTSFNVDDQRKLYAKARNAIQNIKNQSESVDRSVERMKISREKHIYDRHIKYSMAAVCIIFVLIGAPMGAIMRKGGFGYPILVSIIYFVLFLNLTTFFRRFTEQLMLSGLMAAWLPSLILLLIGLLLTYKAQQDAKLMNLDQMGKRLAIFFAFLKTTKNNTTDGSV